MLNAYNERGEESLRKLQLGRQNAFLKPLVGVGVYKELFKEALADNTVTMRGLVVAKYKLLSAKDFDMYQVLWDAKPSKRGERIHQDDRVLSDLALDGTKRVVILDQRGRMVGSKEAAQRIPINAAGDYVLLKYEGHNQKIWNPAHARYEMLPDPDAAKASLGKDMKGEYVDQLNNVSGRKVLEQVNEEYIMRKREPQPRQTKRGTKHIVLGRPIRL